MDKIARPEDLDDYIRVSSPSVWVILTAAALLLIGGIIWGAAGSLDTVITTCAIVKNDRALLLIPESEIDSLSGSAEVNIDGTRVSISSVDKTPVQLSGEENAYALHVGNYSSDDWFYIATAETELDDGVYHAYVTTETLSPISFLFD